MRCAAQKKFPKMNYFEKLPSSLFSYFLSFLSTTRVYCHVILLNKSIHDVLVHSKSESGKIRLVSKQIKLIYRSLTSHYNNRYYAENDESDADPFDWDRNEIEEDKYHNNLRNPEFKSKLRLLVESNYDLTNIHTIEFVGNKYGYQRFNELTNPEFKKLKTVILSDFYDSVESSWGKFPDCNVENVSLLVNYNQYGAETDDVWFPKFQNNIKRLLIENFFGSYLPNSLVELRANGVNFGNEESFDYGAEYSVSLKKFPSELKKIFLKNVGNYSETPCFPSEWPEHLEELHVISCTNVTKFRSPNGGYHSITDMKLPNSLRKLTFSDLGNLNMLPILPSGLEYLDCSNNQLKVLELPYSVKKVVCYDNPVELLSPFDSRYSEEHIFTERDARCKFN